MGYIPIAACGVRCSSTLAYRGTGWRRRRVFPGFGCQVKEIRRDGRGGITSERGEFNRPALHKKESKEKGSRDSKAQQWVMGGKEREEQEKSREATGGGRNRRYGAGAAARPGVWRTSRLGGSVEACVSGWVVAWSQHFEDEEEEKETCTGSRGPWTSREGGPVWQGTGPATQLGTGALSLNRLG